MTNGNPCKQPSVVVAPRDRQWVIEIPLWLPPTTNELTRGKLRVRIRLGQLARAMIAAYVRLAEVPPARGKRRVTLRVHLGPRRQGADVDAYQKATLDGLKHCGAIHDDSRHWCEIAPVQYVKHAPADATVITLEDID